MLSQTKSTVWILFTILFVILLAGAIVLGQRAELLYGDVVLNKLPQDLVSKWMKKNVPSPVILKPPPLLKPSITLTATVMPTIIITSPSDTKTGNNNYILPFSNVRKVTEDDLSGLSPWELKVARNEIYARHGRQFVSKDLSCYFAKQSWYTIDPDYIDSKLSSLEIANAVFILNYEKSVNSPLTNNDSGCKE